MLAPAAPEQGSVLPSSSWVTWSQLLPSVRSGLAGFHRPDPIGSEAQPASALFKAAKFRPALSARADVLAPAGLRPPARAGDRRLPLSQHADICQRSA